MSSNFLSDELELAPEELRQALGEEPPADSEGLEEDFDDEDFDDEDFDDEDDEDFDDEDDLDDEDGDFDESDNTDVLED